MPIKAAEEQRMQLPRRSRVPRSSKNMPRLVGIFAGDVAERDAREPRCEFLRQDGGHVQSPASVGADECPASPADVNWRRFLPRCRPGRAWRGEIAAAAGTCFETRTRTKPQAKQLVVCVDN